MGCLFGSFLSEKHDVILLEQNAERVEALNKNGVTVEEADGTRRHYPVHALMSGTPVPGVELVIVFVKATVTEAALAANRTLLEGGADVLTLQNGLGNDEVIEKFVA